MAATQDDGYTYIDRASIKAGVLKSRPVLQQACTLQATPIYMNINHPTQYPPYRDNTHRHGQHMVHGRTNTSPIMQKPSPNH